jgi:hypothetical protein
MVGTREPRKNLERELGLLRRLRRLAGVGIVIAGFPSRRLPASRDCRQKGLKILGYVPKNSY